MNITAQQFPFLFFLCSLLLLIILSPLLIGSAHGATLLRILFTLVLISAVYVASNNRRNVTIAAILAVAWLVINWFGLERPGAQPGIVGGLLLITLNSYVFFIVLSRILQAKEVSFDVICGGIALYLLIGLTWAVSYSIIEWVEPGSIALPKGSEDWSHLLYFSLTTLTTLGYGDIAPLSPFARIWSTLEAVTGTLYIAVLIARLVSLYRN